MAGRSIRIAFLALASWAVLFAPGSAVGAESDPAHLDPDRVASAVMTPTLGDDGAFAARSCREDADDRADRDAPDGVASSATVAMTTGDVATAHHLGAHIDAGVERHRGGVTRAPPAG